MLEFGALLLGLLAATANGDLIYTAQFYNDLEMHIGTFIFNQGRISIEITSNVGIPEACYATTGYQWHLHDNDNLPRTNGTFAHGFGASECGKPQAGGHYDPTLACSDLSGNAACACLGRNQDYSCEFSSDAFSCELGDFNNKHEGGWIGAGSDALPADGTTIGVQRFEDHYMDVDLTGKSVVFHCGNLQVQFCGALVASETQENNPRVGKNSVFEGPTSLIADFGFGGIVIDDTNILVDVDKAELDKLLAEIPETCYASGFSYHIHEKWTHERNAGFGSDCASAFTGGHWDPTLACGPASANPECGTCGLGGNYDCQFATDPYTCEMGDLSGKYGALSVTAGYQQFSADFLPGLQLMEGKSIVLHCGDGSRAVCAKITQGASRLNTVTFVDGTVVGSGDGTQPPLDCTKVKCARDLNAAVSVELRFFPLAVVLSLFLLR